MTYGPSPCQPHDDNEQGEAHAICHIVEPGEDDAVMWIGFDCGHGGDLSPGLAKFTQWPGDEYRPVDYAKANCVLLAAQLARMTEAA